MSNYEERGPTVWEAWRKRKETNEPILLGKIEKICANCAHCTWVIIKNRFEKYDEFYCHRLNKDGKRITVFMNGNEPKNCKAFVYRSKYDASKP